MSLVLLLIRLLLAVIFAVAGLAKLADLKGSRQALRGFGVPALLAGPFGVLLPLVELAVAVALLLSASDRWGAPGALALLLLFVAGIGYNLARGRTPDCHCFGQLHSAPAGWRTLIRNLVLAAVAGFVVIFGWTTPGPGALDWLAAIATTQWIEVLVGMVLVALLIGEGWVLLQALRQQGRLLLRLEALEARLADAGLAPLTETTAGSTAGTTETAGLPVGEEAPTFSLSGVYGETLTLDALRGWDKPVVLLFSDPGCGPCNALLPEVGRWQRDYAGKLTLAVISRGTREGNLSKMREHGITQVLLQKDREVAEAYQAYGTPSAVLIRQDGTIGSPLAMGADAIGVLITSALNLPAPGALPTAASGDGNGHGAAPAPEQPAVPHVGESAPEFALPDLTGKQVGLADFLGSRTLVLFWNPGCGFCQQMLEDLKAWEARPPKGAPGLLVVSSGTVEANKAMGLRSPVVLDQGFRVGSKFGANGTPMAVLVDAQGKIASELAAGAQAVLRLVSRGQDKPVSA